MNTLVRENRNASQQRSEQFVTPAASVIEDGDAYLLNVEMPGVNKEGLEISVENNELRIIAGDRRNIGPPRVAFGKFPTHVRARSQHRHVEDFGAHRARNSHAQVAQGGAGKAPQNHGQLNAQKAQISKAAHGKCARPFAFFLAKEEAPT